MRLSLCSFENFEILETPAAEAASPVLEAGAGWSSKVQSWFSFRGRGGRFRFCLGFFYGCCHRSEDGDTARKPGLDRLE